jgi:hypothetical protein
VCDANGNVALDDHGNPELHVARRPKDTAWVLTPRYAFRYASRWELRGVRVNPDKTATQPLSSPDAYGPPLVDEWKARAYAQRPTDKTPCCGFENEGFDDWGQSSVTMGEKVGPVRVIRTTWGSDSGTNTIRTELFYPDEIVQQNYLRVHPIPPLGGIFSYWDHTGGVITRYYNPERKTGVAVDGKDDEVFGNDYVAIHDGGAAFYDSDPLLTNHRVHVGSQDGCVEECTDLDVTDPTVNATGTLAWEELAGPYGSMVYRNKLNIQPDHASPGDVQGFFAIPYYRDDKSFDDGTGTDPGLFGAHGVQIIVTPESDNVAMLGTVPITEVDAETRMVVLPGNPGNVGESYGHAADVPLEATVIPAKP